MRTLSTQSTLGAGSALVRAETKMVVRDTSGLVIPIGMPLLILVMNGIGVSQDVFDVYVVPLSLVVVIALVGAVNMPSFLAYYRKTGVLKRLAVTPVHPSMVLVAQVIVSVLQTLLGVVLALGVAVFMFDMSAPANPLLAVIVFTTAAAAMYSLGIVVAAVSPTPNASVAIGLVAFFAMGATGGMFGPPSNLPDAVARVGEFLPFGAAVQALGAAFAGDDVNPAHLIALGVVVLLGCLTGIKFFRWS